MIWKSLSISIRLLNDAIGLYEEKTRENGTDKFKQLTLKNKYVSV